MAQFELLLPKMGESVAEATIVKWLKQPGDTIKEDEAVVEIATDKVDSEVPSPVAGVLISQLYQHNEVAQINSVIAIIKTEGEEKEEKRVEQVFEQPTAIKDLPGADVIIPPHSESPKIAPPSAPAIKQGFRFYSPLVRSIATEEGLSQQELDSIEGTGAEGRVTKQDVLEYVRSKNAGQGSSAKELDVDQNNTSKQEATTQEYQYPIERRLSKEHQPVINIGLGDEIIEMDRMRRLIAEHMVMSKEVSVHVTSFVEADVTNLVKWRDKIKSAFEKREGQKITFTPVFIQAVAKAIKDFPLINVSVDGTRIIKKRDINIGMAAALPSGNLIVPVIKNADQLNLVGLSRAVNDLAKRARGNKLQPDEVKDGTFTITNIGPFGNIMGTPMINQPQVAILAVGSIQKKPAVLETEHGDVIAIRHKMYLSMSYDHRVVDGALGGMFLKRVADYLESWDLNQEI
ncbi:dihydrolipoamide acetyltransferase family protein [Desertivirga brevis]|uniref:dihydrolipoamide acetyltransferase family protein n=1 Tax=Desertivirga brevis TaxID=2810310 RepID=UPI001A979DA5|nr:dihydrolipoamide acetyltransferase family protein [Pedobacter sp. SYSU D00873]